MSWTETGLGESTLARVHAVWSSSDDSLAALLRAGGLDPASSLKGLDLKGWRLAYEDVRGVDFSGADLRGCGIEDAVYDDTTCLDGALLDEGALTWRGGSTQIAADTVSEDSSGVDGFIVEYADILDQEPNHSRAWVDRAGKAWNALRVLPSVERERHAPVFAKKCSDWLLRFHAKANAGLLVRMLGLAEPQELCRPQLLETIVNLLSGLGDSNALEIISSPEFLAIIEKQSKAGLYGLEIRYGDDPRYPFRRGFNTLLWFNNQFDARAQSEKFRQLWTLSLIAFGTQDPPAGDIDRYRGLYKRDLKQLEQNVRDALSGPLKDQRRFDDWPSIAASFLVQQDRLRYLRRIFDGSQRSPQIPQEDVAGLWDGYLYDLAKYAEGEGFAPGLEYGRTVRSRREAVSRALTDKASEWLTNYGPSDAFGARELLNASLGQPSARYTCKLRSERLELVGPFGPVLVLKHRNHIRAFRSAVRELSQELEEAEED